MNSRRLAAGILLLAAAGGAAVPTAAQESPSAGAFSGISADVERVAAEAPQYLVRVIRATEWREGAPANIPRRLIGTGISLGGGRILTCAGIVGPAREVLVAPAGGDTIVARVIATDLRTNIALLDCPGLDLPAMPVAHDGILFPGELVVVVGLGPPGVPRASFGTVILADGPSLGYSDAEMLEVTAPALPGFTGGALLNREGLLVGLVSGRLALEPDEAVVPPGVDLMAGYVEGDHLSTVNPTSATLVLPVSYALEIAGELAELGYVRRGYLGVQVELTDLERPRGRGLHGVLVNQVVLDGPAGEASLMPGDVILEYAGARVQSPEDLSFLVGATVPGSSVPVRYLRKGRRGVVRVTIEQAPDLRWTTDMDASLAARPGSTRVAPATR